MADDLGNINLGINVDTADVSRSLKLLDRMKRDITDLEIKRRKQIITDKDYNRALQQMAIQLGKTTGNINNAKSAMMKYNLAIKSATDQQLRFASVSGKGMRRLEVLAQQAGYQFGDLAVQIQSGTNAAVAFGQQGSQLLGFFGPTGAIAGAGLAIATAFIAPFFKAQKEAEKYQDKLEDLGKTLDRLEDIRLDNVGLSLVKYAKQARSEFDSLLKVMEQTELRLLQKTIKAPFDAVVKELKSFQTKSQLFAQIGSKQPEFESQFGLKSRAEAEFLATQLLRLEGETREELSKQLESITEALQLRGILTEQVAEMLSITAGELGITDQINDRIEARSELQEDLNKLTDDALDGIAAYYREQEKIAKEAQKAADLKRLDARLLEAQLKYGKESIEYAKVAYDVEQSKYRLQIDNGERSLGQIREMMAANGEVLAAKFAIAEEDARLVDLTNELNNQWELVNKELTDFNKGMLEAQRITYTLSAATQSIMDKYASRVSSAQNRGKDPIFGETGKSIYADPKAAKTIKNIQDTIDELREQTKHETKLLALTGERLKEEEVYYDLVLKNKDADIKLSDDKLRAIAKEIAAQQQANEVIQKGIDFAQDLGNAFTDFIMNGFKDFKGFVSSIGDMFKRLLAEMVARALATNIFMPITAGFTGTMLGSAAGAATGSMIGAGAFGGSMLAGIGAGAAGLTSGFMGVMTGGGLGSSFANLGGLLSGSVGGMGAIGAAIPAIAAIAVVVGLFTKKVKQLDSGLRVTIDSTGTLVEQFSKLQTSRLFGLIKSTSTKFTEAGADVADPIVDAIGNMQQSIIDAAGTLGIGAAAFDNFSYQFKVSLKGLTEEEQLQKINEEITKMGDSFASLSGHFSTMNELLAAAQQRYDIETRLLGLLNNQSALLTRQREAERAATNELNRGLIEQVYKLEDAYSAVNSAFAVVQRSIEARKTAITNSFNEIMETIQGRIEAAQSSVGVSGGIVSSLEGAAGGSGMTRGAGLAYLRSLRGASRITDQKKLDDALQAIADPSQDLYTNFVDYQRDFQDQTNLVRELEEKAKLQLSTDEQTLLQLQEEAKAAQARYDSQIEKLDEQLANAQAQLDALYGIDTSVKSVTEAISALGSAINGAMAAQKAAAEAAGVGGGTGAAATGKSFSEQYGTGSQYKGYDLAKLSGSGDLLAAAAMLGVGTTGKTGAQIQQAISNASGMAVRLDNATRSQQFAMGGMFGGGVRMVGERGPELEATGPSRIFSTKQTSELFRNPELVDEVRSLRSEVAGLRSENRQLQTSISKYSKRNYDINRKWDTDGLPATRT